MENLTVIKFRSFFIYLRIGIDQSAARNLARSWKTPKIREIFQSDSEPGTEPSIVSVVSMAAEKHGTAFAQEIKRKCKEKALNNSVTGIPSQAYPAGIPMEAVRDLPANADINKLLLAKALVRYLNF